MTNKYKNKIKNMNFLSKPRTRTVSKEVSINKIRENYRDKETNEELYRTIRGGL